MAAAPHAFLSYTRLDDEAHDGAITALRQRLELRVRAATGDRTFTIFQDIEGIAFGEHWPSSLDEALASARFLIPVLSPSFFTSEPCCAELRKFLAHERAANRRDLILPVYFVTIRDLERQKRANELVRELGERQWEDWRPHANLAESDPQLRVAIGQLAEKVADRLAGALQAAAPPPLTSPGTVFRDIDAPWCPEMVVIPPGRFLMGSPEREEGRSDDEGPQHEVRIGRPFALGRYAVTFAEFDEFVGDASYVAHQPEAPWGAGSMPVVNASWEDAQVYCQWLSRKTGQGYRLPSEAEWEYACRAGTTTPFSFGATILPKQANYNGNHPYRGGPTGLYRQRTVPVDKFGPNSFGLYQMHGNVWEWCEDVDHDSYAGAPSDGNPWVTRQHSSARLLRGGSWDSYPTSCRSARRGKIGSFDRRNIVGVRVARTLSANEAVAPRR